MEKDEYTVMYDIEQSYWWFTGRQLLIKTLLERLRTNSFERGNILDIGCGTGIILKLIKNFGQAFGTELSPEAIHFLKQRDLNLVVQSDANLSIPFKDNTFLAVTCLDVAEHIDNDRCLIEEIFRVCKPGGHVIVTVPAFGFLWSTHDVALHHKRRYSKKQMLMKIHHLNWKVVKCSYYNTALFLPILATRKLQGFLLNHGPHRPVQSDFSIKLPAWVNKALSVLFFLEIRGLKYLNFAFGVSLLLVLQKPSEAET